MRLRFLPALGGLAVAVLLGGCSTIDALNPFVSKGPKIAELTPFKASVDARVVWRENVGKSEIYSFTPAIVGGVVYAAARDGNLSGSRMASAVGVSTPDKPCLAVSAPTDGLSSSVPRRARCSLSMLPMARLCGRQK